MIIKICEICGKEFEARDSRKKYCSDECKRKAGLMRSMAWRTRKKEIRVVWKSEKERKLALERKINAQKLDEFEAGAREQHMSYGQREALKYMKERDANGWARRR